MKAWQEDHIEMLQSIDSETKLFNEITELVSGLGFDYCAYGLRMPLPVSAPKTVMFNNYPEVWQQRYQEQNYVFVDPTVLHGMRSTAPVLWSAELFANSRDLWEDAQSVNLKHGYAQSSRDPNGVSGLLTLARSDETITSSEMYDKGFKMAWLTQTAHLGMARLLTPKMMPEVAVKLTAQEVATLRWTAEGKTSAEVAQILHIAERTVNFHINNAIQKLNAPNKTAAAIRAAMLGILY